ncbi:MAG TPA: hypothetical protein VGQ27_05305 [Steroidobacteraceae bacterium]|jgi:hypothetical protein|nr:hypothetical protein [Steroidobacteraceae bacterium]
MKSIFFTAIAACAICGCATQPAAPPTSWGKEGISMLDYRTDGGQCAVLAATQSSKENGANTAGGINGQNSSAPAQTQGNAAVSAGPSVGASSGGAFPTGGGTYRDMANPDLVQRAATQQRTSDLANQKARTEGLKKCLTDRGYTEFTLSAEQRAHLATLPEGSDARREYLYKLATDANVIKTQAVQHAAPAR